MSHCFGLALDNGVRPREISEIITHLAFYSGWANAMLAATAATTHFLSSCIRYVVKHVCTYHIEKMFPAGRSK
jgi:hypothetical protein